MNHASPPPHRDDEPPSPSQVTPAAVTPTPTEQSQPSLQVGSGNSSSLDSKSEVTAVESLVCGGTAGLLSRFVIAPLDVLKIRLQLQFDPSSGPTTTTAAGAKPHSRVVDTVGKILRQEGVRAFWKGNVPAEIMYVAYGAAQFTTYRAVSDAVRRVYPSAPDATVSFVSGSVSGLAATTLTYPFDLLRTRFAVQGAAGRARVYNSLRYAVWHIQHHEDIAGFFRGLAPALVSVVPYMGLMFSSYTQSRKLLDYLAPPKTGPGATFRDVHPLLISHEAIAGFLAGFISKGSLFPFDVLRKRLQVQGPTREHYMGGTIPLYPQRPLACARYILRREGLAGFYRGFLVSMLKSAPASAITMWTFENSLYLLRASKEHGLVSY